MKRLLLPLLAALALPTAVNAEVWFDDPKDANDYGFFWGSMTKNCLLYNYKKIDGKDTQLLFDSDIRNIKKLVKNEEVKKALSRFGEKGNVKICRKFMPKSI